jgi:RNA recognition motif-containing protein
MVRILETVKFKKVVAAMKYFDMGGKPCRGVPYPYMDDDHYFKNGTNLFINGLDKSIDSKALDDKFKLILGGDHVFYSKVSINRDYTSRGYGFVCFASPELAQIALTAATENNLGFEVYPIQPKDKREMRKSFNNIQIMNFPSYWTE